MLITKFINTCITKFGLFRFELANRSIDRRGALSLLTKKMQFWRYRLLPIVQAIARFFYTRGINAFASDLELDQFLVKHRFWYKQTAATRRTLLQAFFKKAQGDILAAVTRISEARSNKASDEGKEKVSKISESCDLGLPITADAADLGDSLVETCTGLQGNPIVEHDSSVTASVEVLSTASDANCDNFHVSDFIGQRFCHCLRQWHGEPMVECQTCNKWFHPKCIFRESDLQKFENHSWESIQLICNGTVVATHLEKGCGAICRMRPDDVDVELDNVGLRQNRGTDDAAFCNSVCPDTEEAASSVSLSLKVDASTQTTGLASTVSSLVKKNASSQTMGKTDYDAKNGCDDPSSDIDHEDSDLSPSTPHSCKQASTSLEIVISKKFDIPRNLWNEIFCSGSKKHKFGNPKYREILISGILEIYDECVPAIRSHYLRSPHDGGWASLYCTHGQCCTCQVHYRIDFFPGESFVEACTQITGLRNHCRGCIRSRPITGEARSKLCEQLQFCAAATLRDRDYGQLTTAQRALGSHVTVPSEATYRKIKSESKPYKKFERWEENVEAMRSEEEKTDFIFIRSIQLLPKSVTLYSYFQIKAFNFRCETDIIYFDATGSIIMDDSTPGQFQIYSLVVRNPTRGKLSLPVAALVSKKHDATTIGSFLGTFLRDRFQLTGINKHPARIIIDGSYAIWNSTLRAFTSESRIEYYERCFRIATGVPRECDLFQTFYQNCLSHSMKAAKLMVLKHYQAQHKTASMRWICRLFLSETLQDMDDLMESFVILTNCQQTSKLVERHYSNLMTSNESEHQIDPEKLIKDSAANKIPIVDTKSNDDKLEMKSPFYTRYLNMVRKFRSSQEYKNHLITAGVHCDGNNYYSEKFCDVFLKTVSSRLPATSALMVGDLSRHVTSSTSFLQQRYFDEYSLKYSNISKSPCQNYSNNNRTQGCVEQYFGYLKRTSLKYHRATDLDAFVHLYKDSVKVAQKKYYDSVYHCKHFEGIDLEAVLPNPSTATECKKLVKVVESKFKKTKQRDNGHYTHNFDPAKVKFANKVQDEKQSGSSDIASSPVMQTSDATQEEKTDNCDQQTVCMDLTNSSKANKYGKSPRMVELRAEELRNLTPAKFPWDCKNIHDCKKFADSVWEKAICHVAPHDYALSTKGGVCLSWADLLSVNSRKHLTSESSPKQLLDDYPPGWLTLEVVRAYTLIAVMEINENAGKNIAFCSNPYVTWDILQGNLSGVNRLFYPREKVILNDEVELILIPLLWNRHFVLLAFSLKEKRVTLYNSISSSDQKLNNCIRQYLLPCLTSLTSIKNIGYSERTILAQPDSDSCGVCVCVTVDYLCSGLETVPLQQELIEEYRIWILYKLVRMSDKADAQLQEIAAASKRSCIVRLKRIGQIKIGHRYEETDYIPNFKDKTAGAAWIESNKTVLSPVIIILTDLVRSSVEKSEKLAHGYRHSLFVKHDMDSLSKYNLQFRFQELGITISFIADFHEYLMSVFCKSKTRVPFVQGKNVELSQMKENVGVIHEKSIFNSTCPLGNLFSNNRRSITRYIKDVIFYEGLIFYLQISRNSTYLDISRELGFDKKTME